MKKILIFMLFSPCFAQAQVVTTVAGNGSAGYSGDGNAATGAMLNQPAQVAIDDSGNLYFADQYNNCVRKVNTSGIISTFAGNTTSGYSGDSSLATSAELNQPVGVALDTAGNLYIADSYNSCIRKVNTSHIITTIAGNGIGGYSGDGGPANSAQLWYPKLIQTDTFGNIYIADNQNQRIRKINAAGIISTIAGNGGAGYSGDSGIATNAELRFPFGVWSDRSGNLYIADADNNAIRKVSTSGIMYTIAGNGTAGFSGDNGPATAAEITAPGGITMDKTGNLYFSDHANRVRKIDTSGIITTIAGNGVSSYSGDGGPALLAGFNYINSLCFSPSGNLYIADADNNRIREINYTALGFHLVSANNSLMLFPNPNTGLFTIRGSLNLINDENVLVEVADMLGRVTCETNVRSQNGSINTQINMGENTARGLYFLRIKTATQSNLAQFVIAKQ